MSGNDDKSIAKRRDDALGKALNTPPRQHRDMKKGAKAKKRPATAPSVPDPPGRKPQSGQR
jgi:hypothetical protein